MLKKIHTKARPRIFKPAVTKSRWKSNVCVAMAVFLLLLSVSLLHTKLGSEGTDSRKERTSVEVRKISGARKELINQVYVGKEENNFGEEKHVNEKDRFAGNTEQLNARLGKEDLQNLKEGLGAGNGEQRREDSEITEKEEIDEEDEDKIGEEDLENNEMEDFDGFDEDTEDKIDEMDEVDEKENEEDDFPVRGEDEEHEADRSLTARIGNEKDLIGEGEENVSVSENFSRERNIWIGQQNRDRESEVKEDSGVKQRERNDEKIDLVKSIQRLGQIKTIPRLNSNEERKNVRNLPYLIPSESKGTAGQISHKGRAGLFWDHVMGVTRRAFLKHPQRQGAGHLKHPASGNIKSDRGFDIQTNVGWEDSFVDESMAGSNDRSKEAFSSDDEPIDEGIRNGLEEVTAIEDALLLKGSDRSSSLRSGWGPWFDNIQRRASKSNFLMRDRIARSTVDLLNPLNNPLLQDPDAIGPSGLTKSDKTILNALKKASIEGIPFVGEQSSHLEEIPEKNLEETGIEGKGQVQDAAAIQKTLEESNLDGGDEASVKERSNPDNDDDGSLKDITRSGTELTQLTRKALDEHDSNRTVLWHEGGNRNIGELNEAKGTGLIQSVRPAHVDKKKNLSHRRGSTENIRSLAENFDGNRVEVHKSTSYRKNLLNKDKKAWREEDATRRLHGLSVSESHESKHQASLGFDTSFASRTLVADVNRYGSSNKITDYRNVFTSANTTYSNEAVDMDRTVMLRKNRDDGVLVMKQEMDKSTEVTDIGKIQRSGESKRLHHPAQKRGRKKYRRNDDTRRWGYYPGLDPLLSFSEFMDEFLGNGKCSLRVFMAWTTPPWSYTVRYQRGLESLLYFHPDACVVVFSDSIELDFFNDFVKDGYRVAVVIPNLDELLSNTPTHIFASVWLDWRKIDLYYIHYTELLRLAALYKYGGVYLDTDVVVLKAPDSLVNTIGAESFLNEQLSLNGAVMAFEKHSPFLLSCLREFTATYDDTRLRWNGAELLTRVADKFIKAGDKNSEAVKVQPPSVFFPLSFHNISSYFAAPDNQHEREMQEELLKRILNESFALHFWNNLTSKLLPETGSIVERVLNHHCLRCTDIL